MIRGVYMKIILCLILLMALVGCSGSTLRAQNNNFNVSAGSYTIVDTGQTKTFDNFDEIDSPKKGEAFYGQDAQFAKLPMSYTDNGDGTITDNNTDLMWQQGYYVLTYDEALEQLEKLNKEDKYSDWRLPSIKELYSLMDFSGVDVALPLWT